MMSPVEWLQGDENEIEGDNKILDLHVSSETVNSDNINHLGKEQKLCSQVEQTETCMSDVEDELRTSHSDNSGAKS